MGRSVTEGDVAGHVAALLRRHRHAAGLSQVELSERAGISRSRLSNFESGTVPELKTALRIARALTIPAAQMVVAHTRDCVRDVAPELAPEVDAELSSGAVWSAFTRHRLGVERGDVRLLVDDEGNVSMERHYIGCTTTLPRRQLVFRDRVMGHDPGKIDVLRTPVNYDVSSNTEGSWRVHRIKFHEDWSDGRCDIVVTVRVPGAFVLDDFDEYYRRRKSERLGVNEPRGQYDYYVGYAFERLSIEILFPEFYRLTWEEPYSVPERTLLEEFDHNLIGDTCDEVTWQPREHAGRLILTRPLPSYSFGVAWKPRLEIGET